MMASAPLCAQLPDMPNGTSSVKAVGLDDGWRLWLNTGAAWENDKIFLPDEVDLTKLPVNPPTGGWDVLIDQTGIPVSLPGTGMNHAFVPGGPAGFIPVDATRIVYNALHGP